MRFLVTETVVYEVDATSEDDAIEKTIHDGQNVRFVEVSDRVAEVAPANHDRDITVPQGAQDG